MSVSCYSNEDPFYQPAMRVITAITQNNPASVTTAIDHDLEDGIIVRLYIPLIFGMQQANRLTGTIAVTGDDTFTIDIDTREFDSFSTPSPLPNVYTCAQVVPVGEINSSIKNATRNVK